jgi:hypothetical protein
METSRRPETRGDVALAPRRPDAILGVVWALRDATRNAIAGGLLGLVVLGLGGRVIMRLAAVAHPERRGFLTENGNRIGAITADGTLALLLFGGLLFGLLGAVVWTAVGPWIPGRGRRRALIAAPVAVALSGFFVVEADNPDFRILSGDPLVVGLVLAPVFLFDLLFPVAESRLDRALPGPSTRGPAPTLYAAAVVIGAMLVLPAAVGFYFSADACGCVEAPVPVGLAILVAGVATVAWWVARARGAERPQAGVRIVGELALVAAVALGSARLIGEIAAIVRLD